MKIRNKVKYFRILNGISRKELAEMAGVSTTVVGRLETKYAYAVSVGSTYSICDALNVAIEDLLFYTDKPLSLSPAEIERLRRATGVLMKTKSHNYDDVMSQFNR